MSPKRSDHAATDRGARRTALMARVQDGDPDAYRALLDDIRPAVLHMVRIAAVDRHEIPDLVQEVLLALHRARHTYDPLQPFEPWLFSIARYVCTRHRRRRVSQMSWEVLGEGVADRPAEPELGGSRRLEEILQQLPPAQRQAFGLLKLEGLSVKEAARKAGTSAGTLRVRAHRAYRTIRRLLGRE